MYQKLVNTWKMNYFMSTLTTVPSMQLFWKTSIYHRDIYNFNSL